MLPDRTNNLPCPGLPWYAAALTRRRFLTLALAAVPSISLASAVAIEPDRLKVGRIRLNNGPSTRRCVHLTDLHHRDDHQFTEKIISMVRRESPEFTCFTGDLIDDPAHLTGALEFIRALGCPVYGVPGNHDNLFQSSFKQYKGAFAATGGEWLVNKSISIDREIEIVGLDELAPYSLSEPDTIRRIIMTHYPLQVDILAGPAASLVLAGHSHGGQVRFPIVGPLHLPPGVGQYVQGMFPTPIGPLHVSAGLGTSAMKIRFNCRPEITVIDL